MRKVILCLLFAIAMVFGFIGCKNDAPNGSTGSDEQEWHEGNWSTTTCYVYINYAYNDYRFYFTKNELIAAGYDEDEFDATDFAILENPKFKKIIKAELYDLSNGELVATMNRAITIPTDMQGFKANEFDGVIINNLAYIYLGDRTLTPKSNSNAKEIDYFDDGTTLTIYGYNPNL